MHVYRVQWDDPYAENVTSGRSCEKLFTTEDGAACFRERIINAIRLLGKDIAENYVTIVHIVEVDAWT